MENGRKPKVGRMGAFCVIVKLQTSRRFGCSSILGGEEEELVRAHAVQVLVGPVAVGGREDVLGRDQAAAAVGLHSAILHRDTSTLNQSYKS